MMTYIHRDLGGKAHVIGGYYIFTEEARLPFLGRDVLYVIGQAFFDGPVNGVGSYHSIQVHGFIVDWKGRIDKDGYYLSQIQPVQDSTLRAQIRKLIVKIEAIEQIVFE